MAKTPKKMTCADFGLGAILLVPIDGEAHEPLRYFVTPSAVIRASRMRDDLADFSVSYFAARSQGIFEQVGFSETGDTEADVLDFLDRFATTTEDALSGDGGEEPGPTE